LSAWLGNGEVIVVPRLTAGIYLVAKVLGAKKVLLPNNCCPNIVYAILLAGAEPVFCEIDFANGGLELTACADLMAKEKIDLVIHVHMYGLYGERDEIASLCKKYGAFLFEDGGLWFPPVSGYLVLENSCLGLSFGEKKIFDYGVGAVLAVNDISLVARIKDLIKSLPLKPNQPSNYANDYETYTNNSNRLGLATLADIYKDYWLGQCQLPEYDFDQEFIRREKIRRDNLVKKYEEILADVGISLFNVSSLDMPWRFSFGHKEARLVARRIRSLGVNVSHWYPPLDKYFPHHHNKSSDLKKSYRLGNEVCNLWLDNSINIISLELIRLNKSYIFEGRKQCQI
jgi:dTDP-4-amino-4,6-dideoxygalactose transaminase